MPASDAPSTFRPQIPCSAGFSLKPVNSGCVFTSPILASKSGAGDVFLDWYVGSMRCYWKPASLPRLRSEKPDGGCVGKRGLPHERLSSQFRSGTSVYGCDPGGSAARFLGNQLSRPHTTEELPRMLFSLYLKLSCGARVAYTESTPKAPGVRNAAGSPAVLCKRVHTIGNGTVQNRVQMPMAVLKQRLSVAESHTHLLEDLSCPTT